MLEYYNKATTILFLHKLFVSDAQYQHQQHHQGAYRGGRGGANNHHGGNQYGGGNHNNHHETTDNRPPAVVRTSFNVPPSVLSRLRTDSKRDHDAANSATAADWSLSCGSLDTHCSVVRADFKPTDFPAFFADPRSDCITFTLPKPRMFIKPLPATLLVSCSFVANSCSSCSGRSRHHKIGLGAPKLFVLGDEFCPPTCGESGDCCPVIRVRGGCFKDLRKIIDLQIQLGLTIPPRSVAVVFLLSHLLKAGHDKFWMD